MPHVIVDKSELVPILPEIRALFGALGFDIAGYDDDALTDAVVAVCPVVDAGWPGDDQLQRVFQRLAAAKNTPAISRLFWSQSGLKLRRRKGIMPVRPSIRDFLWMASGAAALLAVVLMVWHFRTEQTRPEQLALKARRIALVERMRLALVSASEAEKSAVMAVTDEDSQTYADQARAAAGTVEDARKDLAELLEIDGNGKQKDLLDQFSKNFAEFQRIDKDLLDLAVKNTNLKASSLTFGPAAAALKELDAALARLVIANSADVTTIRLADDARIAALRIQVLLSPHIAEESDAKMDEIEALMAMEDRTVRTSLASLAAMPNLSGNPDLQTATSSYARLSETRAQILKLSRENTNVRSLTISLNQKRRITLVCQDALTALRNAIEQEPIAPAPVNPR